jgi:hypothetical protein
LTIPGKLWLPCSRLATEFSNLSVLTVGVIMLAFDE